MNVISQVNEQNLTRNRHQNQNSSCFGVWNWKRYKKLVLKIIEIVYDDSFGLPPLTSARHGDSQIEACGGTIPIMEL